MYYLLPLRYYDHWHMLVKMIKENYETVENLNSSMILAEYVKRPLADIKRELPAENQRTIVYQLEPLVKKHLWSTQHIINNISDADEIWDYDLQNIEILKQHGLQAKFKPMRYTASLQTVKNLDNPDIDLLFYGGMTEYRNKFLNYFWNATDPEIFKTLNFVWIKNITDAKLDEYIGRSKIILNLNPYDGDTRQQQTRIFYALINNKCVVSQSSPINYFGDSIFEFTDHHSLNRLLKLLLENNNWRNRSINFNKNYAFQNSKIAVFYNVRFIDNYLNKFDQTIVKLQSDYWFDRSDYIHIGYENSVVLPYHLIKVNRCQRNSFANDTLIDMIKFAQLNPNYKILYIDNLYDHNLISNYDFHTIIDKLDNNDLIYTGTNDMNFAGKSSYISDLDMQFINNVISKDQFENWLKKDLI